VSARRATARVRLQGSAADEAVGNADLGGRARGTADASCAAYARALSSRSARALARTAAGAPARAGIARRLAAARAARHRKKTRQPQKDQYKFHTMKLARSLRRAVFRVSARGRRSRTAAANAEVRLVLSRTHQT